jgi:hypothetical protein
MVGKRGYIITFVAAAKPFPWEITIPLMTLQVDIFGGSDMARAAKKWRF